VWKFFVQWVAASEAGRGLIYVSDQKELVHRLKDCVGVLVKGRNTVDMMALMEGFMEARRMVGFEKDMGFLEYLKHHVGNGGEIW